MLPLHHHRMAVGAGIEPALSELTVRRLAAWLPHNERIPRESNPAYPVNSRTYAQRGTQKVGVGGRCYLRLLQAYPPLCFPQCAREESNLWPLPCQGSVLPLNYGRKSSFRFLGNHRGAATPGDAGDPASVRVLLRYRAVARRLVSYATRC